jgi:DNA invertase Pin-like site-specific DNA recombinase
MDVRKFGYIRMSSKDQNEERQLQAMLDNVLKERDI